MTASIIFLSDAATCAGGASKVAVTEAIGLARRGRDVRFLCTTPPIDPALIEAGVRVECLNQPDILSDPSRVAAAVRGIWNGEAERRMAAMLDTVDPAQTIIHIHLWTKGLSLAPLQLALRRGCSAVLSTHDYFSVCPNGALFDFPENRACTRVPMSGACLVRNCDSRHYGHKLWRVARHAVQQRRAQFPASVGHVITLSDYSAALLRPLLPRGLVIHRLENPIDVAPAPRIPVATHRPFVVVGRLSPEKGVSTFLEAARLAGVPARVVGEGPEGPALRLRFPEAVFTGWVDAAAVLTELRAARALVFPSRLHEVLPLSVLEAMSVGLPIVVSDSTAAREHVTDGVSGRWFRAGDAESLANCLRDLARDDVRVESMGQRAYDYFWKSPERFGVDAHIDRLEHIYGSILRDRRLTGAAS